MTSSSETATAGGLTACDGPCYDDLQQGHRFTRPPAVTLTEADVVAYRTICGDHWAPGLDRRLGAALSGDPRPLAHPGLVVAMSIGASTVATRRVIANLFYRGLRLRRPVHLGETLETTTEVRAMSDASPRAGLAPRGKVLLGITTLADGEVVLDYERCALLPCRGGAAPGHADDIGGAATTLDLGSYASVVPVGWRAEDVGARDDWAVGTTRIDRLRDVVDGATALVRLTHNLAAVHRDGATTGDGRRLVYGGHTVALAEASLERSMTGLATLVGWHACDHVGPVFEGDLLSFEHRLIDETTVPGGRLLAIETTAIAHRDGSDAATVLIWAPIVFAA